MRIQKGLVVGMVAVSALGVLAAAVASRADEADLQAVVVVPPGRVQDEVVYALHIKETKERNGIPWVPENAQWVAAGSATYAVLDRLETVDNQGRPRDAVMVAMNASTHGAFLMAFQVGAAGGSSSSDSFSTMYEYVDLGMRTAFRTYLKAGSAAFGNGSLLDDLAISSFAEREPRFDALRYQGMELRVGQDLTDFQHPRFPFFLHGALVGGFGFGLLGDLYPETFLVIEPFDIPFEEADASDGAKFRSWVAERGQLDGREAVGVRTELRFKVPDSPPSEKGRAEAEQALAGGRVSHSCTEWIGAEVPYPLGTRCTTRFKPAGGRESTVGELLWQLAEYRGGQGDRIPWRAGSRSDPALVDFELERSGRAGHPMDGTESRIAYPLSLAVQDVMNDPTLLRFHLWRLSNPDHYLVAATLQPSEQRPAGIPGYVWELEFATTGGEMFEAITERRPGVPLPLTQGRSHSDDDYNPVVFNAGNFSANPLTLAAAEAQWRRLASEEYRDLPVTFLHWGIVAADAFDTMGCLSPEVHGPDALDDLSGTDGFRWVQLGFTSGTDCTSQASEWRESTVAINLDTGAPMLHYEVRKTFEYPGHGLSLPEPKREIPVSTASLSSAPRALGAFAFTTTAGLAVLLAVYFYPLLKFLGARSALSIPGFSKLERSRLLDNRVRDSLLQEIQQEPGVHASELHRRLSVGWGTVVYHLHVLEQNRVVSSLVDGREKRFFPMGVVDWSKRGQLAALRHERAKQLYDLILEEPGAATTALAQRAHVSVPAALWHLRRLEDAGLVGRVKEGRAVRYFASPSNAIPTPPDVNQSVEVA